MEQQMLTQNVDTLFANLETFAQKEGLIGKAVSQGDKTFLPVLSISLGYGGGDTQSKSSPSNATTASTKSSTVLGNMSGGALGLGARISTDAVFIINKDDVSMIPIAAPSSISQMVEKVPQILSSISSQNGQSQGNQPAQPTQGQ